jgi:hypothetical protein
MDASDIAGPYLGSGACRRNWRARKPAPATLGPRPKPDNGCADDTSPEELTGANSLTLTATQGEFGFNDHSASKKILVARFPSGGIPAGGANATQPF